jgi:hypothetical protein
MRSALFRGCTLRWMVVSYRCFGRAYRSHLQGSSSSSWTAWTVKMGPKVDPKRPWSTTILQYADLNTIIFRWIQNLIFTTPSIRGGNSPLQRVFVNVRSPRKTWSSAGDLWWNIDCFDCVFDFRCILCAVWAGYTGGVDHQKRNSFSQICVNILVAK